jgi:hypothetical protein
MKMNLIAWLCLVGLVAIEMAGVVRKCDAAEAVPYSTTPNAPAVSGVRTLTPGTNTQLTAWKLQAALLKDLAQEHSSRAAEAALSNQVERVKWETELAGELQDRSARLLKVMDQVSSQSNGSEGGQPPLGTGGISEMKGMTDEEIEFLARLEDKRVKLAQELDFALEQSRGNAMQLSTNNVLENVQKIAFVEEENQRSIRSLQKEQFDLELKRLEYRAIRRLLKK